MAAGVGTFGDLLRIALKGDKEPDSLELRSAVSHDGSVPRFPDRDYSTRLARANRRSLSGPEMRLWWYLRVRLAAKFRRQVPLGPYIADFVCYPARLVVEVDGSQHGDQVSYDRQRDRHLARLGFMTVRFSTYEVMKEIDDVINTIGGLVARRSGAQS